MFSFNKETPNKKGQKGTTGVPGQAGQEALCQSASESAVPFQLPPAQPQKHPANATFGARHASAVRLDYIWEKCRYEALPGEISKTCPV